MVYLLNVRSPSNESISKRRLLWEKKIVKIQIKELLIRIREGKL